MKIAGNCGAQLLVKPAVVLVVFAIVFLSAGFPVWASGGGGEPHEVSWQATDWFRVMNFAVLAVGLFLLLKKPASQALNGRIKSISQELKELEAKKAEVEKELADYNNQLASLDREAEQIVAEYIRQGEDAKARILKEAEATADKLKEHAQKNIEHEFKQAKLALQEQIVEKALYKAEAMIAEKISAEDQTRLVDEYLDKVVA